MRSGLDTAKYATAPAAASSGRMKIRSLTPEKNSAPEHDEHEDHRGAEVIAGHDRPDRRAPTTGTSGMNTCRQSPSSVCLRNST